MSRASGVPLAAAAARQYDPPGALAAADGTVPLARPPIARRLAAALNARRGRPGAPGVPAGELHAFGLIHEVFHHLIARYEREARPRAVADALAWVARERGDGPTGRLLEAYADAFPAAVPAPPVRRPEALEELLLTWLANANPAVQPMREIVDDRAVAAQADYAGAMAAAEAFFAGQPRFGPDRQTLVEMLRAPALASPGSLAGQLRFIRDRWGALLGDLLERLLLGLDVIAEEERALGLRLAGAQGGFGGVAEGPSFHGLEAEPERFSADRDWMPRLVLIAKSTYVWLDQLSRRHGREIRTLDAIPDEELDRLARWGVTGLWLIGLWQRSRASEQIKRLRGNPEAAASAYSLDEYRIADDLGGEDACARLRERAWARGIRLASDMVPNHMGIDSRWVIEHPEWFISLPEPPYPVYRFTGPDLSPDGRVGIFLEDHYWDSRDAAVVFRRLDRWTGQDRYVYHGNDGTSFPWNDTAQLDYLNPEVREAVVRTILDVARRFPVIRFDAAMVLAKRHIQRLWYPEPGAGGAIPSRAEHGAMAAAEFDRRMPVEFWREVVDRVAAEVPDTLLLAEAFWLLEGYFVRTLGMHRVYNSAFMHMLRDENNAGYRRVLRDTLEFDPEILQRFVNFMNNPDEKTAVEQFGRDDKYFGVATLLATLPGLPLLGHGQVEGLAEKYGMEFRRATLDEAPDGGLVERHEREIFPLLHRRARFAGARDFLLYDVVTDGGAVDENVFAYSNGRGPDRTLVIYHNRFASTAGTIHRSVAYAVKDPDGSRRLVRRTLGEGLELSGDPGGLIAFRDARTGLEHLHAGRTLQERGLRVALDAYRTHVFWEFREVRDGQAGLWGRLAERLGGAGVPSLDEALRRLQLEPVHEPLRAVVAGPLGPVVRDGALLAAGAVGPGLGRLADAVRAATGAAGDAAAYVTPARARIDALARLVAGQERPGPGPLDRVRPALRSAWHRAVLAGWAVLEPLGRLVPGAMVGPTSRAWFDELRLAPALGEALRAAGLDEGGAAAAAERVRALLALPRPANVGGRATADRAARLVAAWLAHPDVRPFLRVNTWEDVEWFGADEWRELLDWTLLLDALEATAGTATAASARPRRIRAAATVVEALAAAGEAAGYRVERLREAFPAPRAASRPRGRPDAGRRRPPR
jgi:glycosidase